MERKLLYFHLLSEKKIANQTEIRPLSAGVEIKTHIGFRKLDTPKTMLTHNSSCRLYTKIRPAPMHVFPEL